LKKQAEYQRKLEAIQKEKEELNLRLDALRKSVQVLVERDWTRATQDTIAMVEHRKRDSKVHNSQVGGLVRDGGVQFG
jgi:hypothetical protein